MFSASKALFIYCVSPVHMGAGTALGLIDNPIQRERHTEYPMIAGSGLKGAVRHHFWSQIPEDIRTDTEKYKTHLLNRLFGPETNASDFAGAVSFGDAQLVAFPVRSVKKAFVYATSPTALARVARLLVLVGDAPNWSAVTTETGHCQLVNPALLTGNQLHLEAFEFTAHLNQSLRQISEWLSQHALPNQPAYNFFREKLRDDLVLLSDEEFGYFARNAMVVEPHVCIDNNTGAAKGTGLFYTENLPPESLLLAPVMASVERSSKGVLNAEQVLESVLQGSEGAWKGLDSALLQIGGDATTGRGQVILKAVGGK